MSRIGLLAHAHSRPIRLSSVLARERLRVPTRLSAPLLRPDSGTAGTDQPPRPTG
jgi:hypothetical protein